MPIRRRRIRITIPSPELVEAAINKFLSKKDDDLETAQQICDETKRKNYEKYRNEMKEILAKANIREPTFKDGYKIPRK